MPVPLVVQSSSAAARLAEARRFIESFPPSSERVVVGSSREAADDFVRDLSRRRGATFGVHRFGFSQLVARLAALDLARRGLAPATRLGSEAVAARAAFEAAEHGALHYVTPVARSRGFPRALADTVADLRRSAIDAGRLSGLGNPGADLQRLTAAYATELEQARLADRAAMLRIATVAVRGTLAAPLVRAPALLLDVPVESDAEMAFFEAWRDASARMCVTLPGGDERAAAAWRHLAGELGVSRLEEAAAGDPLARVRQYLFALDVPAPDAPCSAGAVSLFSAPGEAREAVEVARRALEEAARGVPFDEMAILVRAPSVYGGLLESACRRARVPAWFARGTSAPHPAGRAFLAVLACAAEGLSASRFAEYLSLGQVPALDERGRPLSAEPTWVPPDAAEQPLPEAAAAVAVRFTGQLSLFDTPELSDTPDPAPDSDDAPVLEGTLRAPWKWERLLVESSVIGGGCERWERRLEGLRRELQLRREELASEDPEGPRLRGLERDLADLAHLTRFALPVLRALAALPAAAPWGEWMAALERLAPLVLRRPEHVLVVLAELRPMSAVGPVRLDEVQRVLVERLASVREEPPADRYGRVFVATPDQARGRQFRVVLLPGLAERIFPQRPHDDPLLLEPARQALNAEAGTGTATSLGLPTLEDRAARERLLLRLAVGAATERLYLSYPRMEVTESRPRVPSFYALDVARALTGRVPDFHELEREAYDAGGARLAWPAPADPDRAIDDTEHDLAVLGRLLRGEAPGETHGRARYLLELDPTLGRSLRTRYMRWDKQWWHVDGFYKPDRGAYDALQAHRLSARAYSVSALQKFAVCPYQFLLSAICRLEPRKQLAPLERMDPLTRGHVFHRVQAELVRALQRTCALPLSAETLPAARAVLDATLDAVEQAYRDELVPAIERVWRDEIDSIRADLRAWLERVADEGGGWAPLHTEFGFGFPPGEGRDAASRADPVVLASTWKLHGIVDLIERSADGDRLRVTDHKTGKVRAKDGVIVGGGEVLQPVLYGLAVEQALGHPVVSSRLFYCTAAGNFTERSVTLDETARHHGVEVLQIVDRAIEHGTLPPAPKERACAWCDFRPVCGPWEHRRIARKPAGPLEDLQALRALP